MNFEVNQWNNTDKVDSDYKSIENKTLEVKQKFPDNIINHFKSYNWVRWMGFVGFLLYTVATVFTIVSIVEDLLAGQPWAVFFGTLDRFTNESNLLLWLFMIFWLFFRKHSFMKENKALIACMTYIFFTFFGYNVILIAMGGGRYGYNLNNGAYGLVTNIWWHLLCPLYFIAFGLCVMYDEPNKEPKKFVRSLLSAMIYPTIYVIYVATIPFVYTAPTTDYGTYYNWFNNNYPNGYTVYSSATNTAYTNTAWAYILIIWLVFFPGSYSGFYFAWKKGFNKLNAKKQNNK